MQPPDWARTEARRLFDLPADRDELVARYAFGDVGPSVQLGCLIDHAEAQGADRAVLESPYVDFDYRSEYANLYSRSFNPPPDKCERVLFFSGGRFLGFVVLRPSVKPVGRSGVAPGPAVEPFVCCLAPHEVRPLGESFQTEAWPFLSQDGVYGRCAHAAIWSIARFHHLQHGAPRQSIASVVEASGTKPEVDKTFRSSGLYLHQVAHAFERLGLPSLPYAPKHLSSGEDLEATVCRYLNSHFPVALSTPRHLTVLTGYGHDRDGKLFFIRSDDNGDAYERVPDWQEDRLGAWDMLLVPLPARIHVPGAAAEARALKTLFVQAGAVSETKATLDKLLGRELSLRTYAIDAADYKGQLGSRGLPSEVVRDHLATPMSAWIWVTEFQVRELADRVKHDRKLVHSQRLKTGPLSSEMDRPPQRRP